MYIMKKIVPARIRNGPIILVGRSIKGMHVYFVKPLSRHRSINNEKQSIKQSHL